jgi:hypothetical protein
VIVLPGPGARLRCVGVGECFWNSGRESIPRLGFVSGVNTAPYVSRASTAPRLNPSMLVRRWQPGALGCRSGRAPGLVLSPDLGSRAHAPGLSTGGNGVTTTSAGWDTTTGRNSDSWIGPERYTEHTMLTAYGATGRGRALLSRSATTITTDGAALCQVEAEVTIRRTHVGTGRAGAGVSACTHRIITARPAAADLWRRAAGSRLAVLARVDPADADPRMARLADRADRRADGRW